MSEEKRNTGKLTLEELLRVKKAEQPDEMFWSRFDRELEKKIVRSVISREPRIYAGMRWLKSHAVFTASCAFLVFASGLILIRSVENEDLPSSAALQPTVRQSLAGAEPDSTARPRVDAPALSGSRSDFVIEVLSSNGAVASGANLTLSGRQKPEEGGAYYVADQLSSADQGWSGERLPF